jgi:hypothetical protein
MQIIRTVKWANIIFMKLCTDTGCAALSIRYYVENETVVFCVRFLQ